MLRFQWIKCTEFLESLLLWDSSFLLDQSCVQHLRLLRSFCLSWDLSPSILLNRFALPTQLKSSLSALFQSSGFQILHGSPPAGAISRFDQEISPAERLHTLFPLFLWSSMKTSNVVFHVDLEGIGSSGCHLPLLSFSPPCPCALLFLLSRQSPSPFPKNPFFFQSQAQLSSASPLLHFSIIPLAPSLIHFLK